MTEQSATQSMEGFEGFLRVSETAKRLGISNQRVRQLLAEEKLRAKLTPYGRVIEVKSIDEYDVSRRDYRWAELQKADREQRENGAGEGGEGESGEGEGESGEGESGGVEESSE